MGLSSDAEAKKDGRVLISGGGIAGLTLGILLKESGWDPLVIEREPALRTEGYMMDFFGTGWDVAERMGLVDDIRRIGYPIDLLEYVDRNGNPLFPGIPIDRVKRALGGKYTPLLRPDLERILFDRAAASGVTVRFATTIRSLQESDSGVNVTFSDGTSEPFALLFGADGIHSRVRELIFGQESQFDRSLGYYAAAVRVTDHEYDLRRSLNIYEEPGRVLWCYPIDSRNTDALYFFRHDDVGHIPREKRLEFVREQYKGCGWIAERILQEAPSSKPIYFDTMTQIVMPTWHKGRTALLGDACGCLTPIAGQGSHMAMAGAYVITHELERYHGEHQRAFSAYEGFMKPFVAEKQDRAKRYAEMLIPSSRWQMLLRYPLLRMIFSGPFIRRLFAVFGGKSILTGYR
jgi:2-polyprenyl-6-methoxyphenol hydroxylase-like FAD-dependent oxidoreductase